MSLLEDPEIKKNYDHCKRIVKIWENKFTKQHKRLPSKLDIKEASNEVRNAYRRYFKLKTAALEESFMDVEGLEDDECIEFSTPDVEGPPVSEHVETNSLPEGNKIHGEEQETVENNNKEAWGEHLNVQKTDFEEETTNNSDKKLSEPVQSITQKLFCGSKVTKLKRNPRKSLSLAAKKNTSASSETPTFFSQPEPILGTFKSEEAIQILRSEIGGTSVINVSDPIKQITQPLLPVNIINRKQGSRKIDMGWIKRIADTTGISMNNEELTQSHKDVQVESLNTQIDYDSDEIIGDSDEEDNHQSVYHISKKSRLNWKPVQSNNTIDNVDNSKENITSNIPEVSENLEEDITKPSLTMNNMSNEEKIHTPRYTKENEKTSQPPLVAVDLQSVRRSTRTTKVKSSFQELSSGEEDPFASDNDDQDPEFDLNEKNKKKNMFYEPEPEPTESKIKNRRLGSKVKPVQEKISVKNKKPPKTKEPKCNSEDNTVYELEYSVKPRVVAPRFNNIKSVIKEKLAVSTKEQPSADNKMLPKDKRQQAKEKLAQKVASGGLNENFVTINLRKKVFVRGKKNHNFSKYKKAQWKSKKKALYGPDMDMGGCDGGKLICFNCGQEGHFAQRCKAEKGDSLLPLGGENEEEECSYPTLEEASKMACESVLSIKKPKIVPTNTGEGDENSEQEKEEEEEDEWSDGIDDEILLAEIDKLEENVKNLDVNVYIDCPKVVKPYYELKENGTLIDTPSEVYEALHRFGYDSFRSGQEKAIMRILSGKSTLVTLSTGSGKSLCYQLPAYLYAEREPCISLIISPLVSLMEDQITGIPKFLKAACLHTNQTKTQREKIIEAISSGSLNVLLISPEAVVAGEKQTGFGSLFRKLPPIAFACIDEAHCVSQWSHNFRPSYLMICRVLKESLGVHTILGLTATATRSTCQNIIDSLAIPDGFDGIISDVPLPDNLYLTASKDANRDRALLNLLLSDRFKDSKSIIVYCTRREECERIAGFLRTSLKSECFVESTNKKRKRLNLQAEPYHAGLAASRRRTVQNAFMSGDLRVVVATVAFGMGINKSDIRAVIHFNMPNSFESYVQEVGRAGRDGLPAHCHVFLDSEGRDENELRRHIHANSIERHVVRKLLQKIFVPCACKGTCPKHEVAFSIEQTVRALDIPEENISTLLCYLELHENKYIELLNPAYTRCKVISYGGPLQIRKAAKNCPPLAMALALYPGKEGEDNILEFPVVDVASAMGWESGICKHKLKNLEWTTVDNRPKRSTLSVQFLDLGFRMLAPGNLSDEQLDEALDSLYEKVQKQENKALKQLHTVHKTLLGVAEKSYLSCIELSKGSQPMETLKDIIRDYFNSPDPLVNIDVALAGQVNEEQLVTDIRTVICMYKDNHFNGRAIARIFHGIQSPNYPAVIWGRSKYWRSHLNEDFHEICRIATREIIRMRH